MDGLRLKARHESLRLTGRLDGEMETIEKRTFLGIKATMECNGSNDGDMETIEKGIGGWIVIEMQPATMIS